MERAVVEPGQLAGQTVDVETVTNQVLDQISTNRAFAELVAESLKGAKGFFAVPSEELIASDETFEVEFKSTARWNLDEARKDKRMEDAVVKTVAGLLNADGETLFLGVDNDRRAVGLAWDVELVKPKNVEGLVNWLTTHLSTALGEPAVMRTRARIEELSGTEICRVDISASSVPIKARMSDKNGVFWVRMNNSTRALSEIDEYRRDRWP